MNELSWAAIVRTVHERANFCCEYCHTCQEIIGHAMHVEHIEPNKDNSLDNLCLACANCNLSKAQATTGIDPQTDEISTLFHPRKQIWSEHFQWIDGGLRLMGLTSVGRATVVRLKINMDRVINARAFWIAIGVHPPTHLND